jgi:hypothetical protein
MVKGAKEFQTPAAVADPGIFSRYVTGLKDAVVGAGTSLYHAFADPQTAAEKASGVPIVSTQAPFFPQAAKRMLVDPQIEQYHQAKEAEKQGRTSEMVGHAVAAAVPGAGPVAAAIGQRAGTGDFAGAAGMATPVVAAELAGPVVGAADKLTAPDAMMMRAAKLREIQNAGFNKKAAGFGMAVGGVAGYKMGGPYEAAAGAATGGALAGEGVPVVAGKLADLAERVAKIRAGRPEPVQQANPIPDATAQAQSPIPSPAPQTAPATIPMPQAPIASSRGSDTGYVPKFGEGEVGAPATAPPPAGEFSPVAKGPNDAAHYDALNNATMNRVLGIREPEDITGQATTPPGEAPAAQPAVPENVQNLAYAIIRRGKGKIGADLALTNAQYLLKMMPELDGLSEVPDSTGVSPLDRHLTERLNQTGHEINAELQQNADKQVSTVNAKSELNVLAEMARTSNQTSLFNNINKLGKLFADKNTVSGQEVADIRQHLNDSPIDISEGIGKNVYEVFKQLTEQVSPKLADLNKDYFTIKTATELAEIRTGGKTAESQVGAGTRPKQNYSDFEKARIDKLKEIQAANDAAAKGEAKAGTAAEKAAQKATDKAAADKAAADKKALADKAAETLRRQRLDKANQESKAKGLNL